MTVTIYHNPRCSKSRQTLQLLQDRGIEPEIVEYLKNPPDLETLQALQRKLGVAAAEMLRDNEDEYRQLGLNAPDVGDDDKLQAVTQHPRLLQRPIVVKGDKAAIGRPPENVLDILS